jgi:hypothetical protein
MGVLLAFLVYFGPIVLIGWGWVRWEKSSQHFEWGSALSLVGFVLASAACLLGVGTTIYARAIGGFPFYDPRLLRIYRWGILLSLLGLLCSVAGIWHRNSIRWHAPLASLGMLVYWFLSAASE